MISGAELPDLYIVAGTIYNKFPFCKQLLMISCFPDLSLVQNDDFISILNS